MTGAQVIGRRRLAGGLLGGCWRWAAGGGARPRAEPSADAARAMIETVGNKVLEVLRDPGSERRRRSSTGWSRC